MDDPQNEPLEDDEEELPPPHQSHKWLIMIGAIVLITLIAIGSTAAIHALTKATVVPTPTAIDYGPPVPTPWVEPGMFCNQAVQKIAQNQIALILVYRENQGGPAIPQNAITGIEVLPRGIPYHGDPAQSVQTSLLAILETYPDQTCWPQMLAAVQHINKTLPKSEQVKVKYYPTD